MGISYGRITINMSVEDAKMCWYIIQSSLPDYLWKGEVGRYLGLLLNQLEEACYCPECGRLDPDDDRIIAGMKCGRCAGYGQEEEE